MSTAFGSRGFALGLPALQQYTQGNEYGYGLAYGVEGFSRGRYQANRQPLILVPLPYHVRRGLPRTVVTTWPADAVALLRKLQVTDDLKKLAGGISVARQEDGYSAAQELASREETWQLYAKSAWLTRDDERRNSSPLLVWCDEKERGNQSLAFDMDEWLQVSNWQAERGQFLAAEKT